MGAILKAGRIRALLEFCKTENPMRTHDWVVGRGRRVVILDSGIAFVQWCGKMCRLEADGDRINLIKIDYQKNLPPNPWLQRQRSKPG